MNIDDVRDGAARALKTIAALTAYEYLPDAPVLPCAVVGLPTRVYDLTFSRGVDRLTLPVIVLLARGVDRYDSKLLNGILAGDGPLSIKAAIEADRTLGGACSGARVTQANPVEETLGGQTGSNYVGYRFEVDVVGRGTT